MSEAAFTADFKKHLKKTRVLQGHSFFFYKVSDRFTSGIPDFFVAFRGKAAYIELKDTGEKPTDIQMYQMKRLQQAGIMAVWFDSLPVAVKFIDDLVEKNTKLRL